MIGTAMKAAGAAIAAAGIGTLLKDSISLASDAEQSLGGVQAVFKGYAKDVVTASKNADQALGLSANSYRELATVIGAQLKNAGISMDELGPRTDSLVTMGADLAAMFGGTTKEAVEALSSALKGEMDPIERYGISLNDATLKSKALELGLYSGKGALDQNAKAMAVMALVTEQGKDAVGAFAREQDTAAGKAARSAAQWENLRTELGNKLLPIWSSLLSFINEKFLPGIIKVSSWLGDKLGPAVKQVGGFITGTAVPAVRSFAEWVGRNHDVIVPVVVALGSMLAAFKAFMFIKTVIAAVAAFNAVLLANPIGLVVAAIAGLVAILVVAYKRSETFRKIVDTAFRVVAAAGKWMWENVLKPTFRFLMDAWNAVAKGIKWAWDNLIKPAWSALQTAIRFLWNNVLKPVFGAIGSAWRNLSSGIRSVWTGVILPVFNAFKAIGETVRRAFSAAIDGIKRIWDNVKNVLKKPIQAVIDVVWNNGLRKMWNFVNNLWGGDDLGRVSLATGGVMPGYTPGRDVHSFFSPTAGRLDLSGGEAVMRPEWTRVLGKPTIDYWNQVARQEGEAGLRRVMSQGYSQNAHQHFARGGITEVPGWLKGGISLFNVGGNALVAKLNALAKGVNSHDTGGGLLGSGLLGLFKRVSSRMWAKAKELFDNEKAKLGEASVTSTGGFGRGVGGKLGSTWHSIWNVVKAAIPQARINSTFRPGDPGYHGRNKAIDFGYGVGPGGPGNYGLAKIEAFLYDRYRGSLAELIYDGVGNARSNWWKGRNYAYSGLTQSQHRNHVHAAVYDKGGLLPPGVSVVANNTGKHETIRTAEQEAALHRPIVIQINGTFDLASSRDLDKAAQVMRQKIIELDRRQR